MTIHIFTFLFLLSILFLAVGLIKPRWAILWGCAENKKRKKVLATGISALAVSLFGMICFNSSPEQIPAQVPQQVIMSDSQTPVPETPPPPAMPEYSIVQTSDAGVRQDKRYSCDVVVKSPATLEQLKDICADVMQKVKKEKHFDELTVFLYDYPEFIGQGSTLGKVTFSDKALKWGILQKDWNLRLTADEVKVYFAWFSTRETIHKSGQNESEKITTQKIAKQFKLTPEAVDKILTKKLVWQFDGD